MKHSCHGSLICGSGILKTKWNDSAVEIPNRRAERGFLGICWRHEDLIVIAKTIHKGEHRMTRSGINQKIHFGQREFILGTHFVEITEIHTTSDLAILFLHGDYVGQPPWVLYWLDKAG